MRSTNFRINENGNWLGEKDDLPQLNPRSLELFVLGRLYYINPQLIHELHWNDQDRDIASGPIDMSREEALALSIEKWELITAYLTKHPRSSVKFNSVVTCGLCRKYNNTKTPDGRECWGCPVHMKTRKMYCKGSPFEEIGEIYGGLPAEYLEDCKKEVAFLKSLRK